MATKATPTYKPTGKELTEMWEHMPYNEFTKMIKRGEWPRRYKVTGTLRKMVIIEGQEQETIANNADIALQRWEPAMRATLTSRNNMNPFFWSTVPSKVVTSRTVSHKRKYMDAKDGEQYELEVKVEMMT